MNSEKHETKITHMVVVSNKIYSLLETTDTSGDRSKIYLNPVYYL